MWGECKGFIAIMSIILLCACLVIIGMFIQKEASSVKESTETTAGEHNNESH